LSLVRRLKVGPALHELPTRNSPDYDAAESQSLTILRICRGPAISHHHPVVFRNHVFDLYMEIGKSLQRAAHIFDRASRPRRHARWHIRPVIHKFRSEVYISDLDVFPVYELLEVVADKFPRFLMRHSGF
jgi:hypothetical protein